MCPNNNPYRKIGINCTAESSNKLWIFRKDAYLNTYLPGINGGKKETQTFYGIYKSSLFSQRKSYCTKRSPYERWPIIHRYQTMPKQELPALEFFSWLNGIFLTHETIRKIYLVITCVRDIKSKIFCYINARPHLLAEISIME